MKRQKSKKYLIEADSQFTIEYPEVSQDWELDNKLKELIKFGHLRFGHGIFGNYHHTFFLRLRNINDFIRSKITKDILIKYSSCFDKKPDLILCPSDSTGIRILERNEEISQDSCVMLGKARQEYGNYELRLELSKQHRHIIQNSNKLHIIFLDDSKSTGKTERKAVSAFLNTIGKLKFSSIKLNWFSYIILKRGVRESVNGKKITNDIPELLKLGLKNTGCEYEYKDFFYSTIGPESKTEKVCPFEKSINQLAILRDISNYGRRDYVNLVDLIYDHIEEKSIDRAKLQERIPSIVTSNLLHLCNLEMPHAAIKIGTNNDTPLTKEQLAASALFISIHYNDVVNYLSVDCLIAIFQDYATKIIDDENPSAIILLVALSLVPTSFAETMCSEVVKKLICNNSLNTASVILAIVISGHNLVEKRFMQKKYSKNKMYFNTSDFFISKRKKEFISNAKLMLQSFTSETEKDYELLKRYELVLADFSALTTSDNVEDVVNVAKKLAALTYDGGHKFFMLRELENITKKSLPPTSRNIRVALDLTQMLADLLNLNIQQTINSYKKRFQKITNEIDINGFKLLGKDFHNYIWKSGPFTPFFYFPKRLFNNLTQAKKNIIKEYSSYDMPQGLLKILNSKDNISSWHFLAPESSFVTEHIYNLFHNSFKYFYEGKNGDSQPDYEILFNTLKEKGFGHKSPLMYIYMQLDIDNGYLSLECANRAAKPNPQKLFYPSNGLGSSKIRFQHLGGDVLYEYREKGLLGRLLNEDMKDNDEIKDPELYKNIFITKMPLIWENRA